MPFVLSSIRVARCRRLWVAAPALRASFRETACLPPESFRLLSARVFSKRGACPAAESTRLTGLWLRCRILPNPAAVTWPSILKCFSTSAPLTTATSLIRRKVRPTAARFERHAVTGCARSVFQRRCGRAFREAALFWRCVAGVFVQPYGCRDRCRGGSDIRSSGQPVGRANTGVQS